ncbi:MAG: UTP--glucose-1-phosphate uridylyltransferase [Alphaproteobacteria bacterium]|nr:UTP--glucose-1-phosphate uridylyltransferase [Alphaproteobacteria bacterium]
MTLIKTAVFPVAGLGTRFLPITKAIAKEMLVIVDKPLIQYAVEEALEAGIEKFIFVSSHGKNSIQDHFDAAPLLEETLIERGKLNDLEKVRAAQLKSGQAIFVRQDSPKGLGHAVYCAHNLIQEEAFAVILADDLLMGENTGNGCLKQMIDNYHPDDGQMLAVENIPQSQTFRYGILDVASQVGRKIHAKKIIEKPQPQDAPSTIAAVGRYILKRSIFDVLRNAKATVGNEIQLTDAIETMRQQGTPLTGMMYEGTRYDCGMKLGWLQANLAVALKDESISQETMLMMKDFVEKA